jgi:hypothetical protein
MTRVELRMERTLGGALTHPVDNAESRSARRGVALRRRDGARDRPVHATGAGMRRERGPEDASNEGTHLKSNRPRFDFRYVRYLRGEFLWVLSLLVQGK